MYRHLSTGLLAGLLLACATGASASDSLRVGNRLLMVGDSAVTVTELLGKPSHKSHHNASRGASSNRRGKRTRTATAGQASGEQWQYRRDGRVIVVTLVDGRVSDIDERSS
jgi:hypothetical protein